jgi:hypothetical protein
MIGFGTCPRLEKPAVHYSLLALGRRAIFTPAVLLAGVSSSPCNVCFASDAVPWPQELGRGRLVIYVPGSHECHSYVLINRIDELLRRMSNALGSKKSRLSSNRHDYKAMRLSTAATNIVSKQADNRDLEAKEKADLHESKIDP